MKVSTSGLRQDSPSRPLLQALISYQGITDAAGAASGLTIVCGDLVNEPSYDGLLLKIRSGAAAGQVKPIYVQAGNTLTFATPWTNAAGAVVQIPARTLFDILSISAGSSGPGPSPTEGLSYYGVVDDVPGANQFTIGSLAGLGAGKFADAVNPYVVFVLRDAGGLSAAPQGEQLPVTAYAVAGVFTTAAFTDDIAVGDEILIIHPDIAANIAILTGLSVSGIDGVINLLMRDVIGNKADTALTAYTAVDSMMRYVKGLIDQAATLTTRLSAVRAGYLDELDAANIPADIDTLLVRLPAVLSAVRIAYLDQLDFDLQAAIAAIPTVMVGTDNAALAVNWTAALATALGNYTAVRAGYLDELDFDLQTAIAALQTDLDNPAQYQADLTTLETRLSAIRAGYLDQLDFNLAEAIAAIPTVMEGTDDAMLAVNGALEATLTAMKGAGFVTGTDSLKILSDVLDAITAAGPTNAQMETARDAIIAAIPAMVGTDNAALAATALSTAQWTNALATALGNYTAARAGYLDNINQAGLLQVTAARAALLDQITAARLTELDAANIPADIDTLKTRLPSVLSTARIGYLDELAAANLPTDITALATSQGRMLFTMDFWSLPQKTVAIPIAAADQALPDITVADFPAGATAVRVQVMFKFRSLSNAGAANKLTNAQEIQIRTDAPGAWTDAINLVDDQFLIAAAAVDTPGDVVMGLINVAATVTGNDTYNLQWDEAIADVAGLTFNDVQVGLRIWYSV